MSLITRRARRAARRGAEIAEFVDVDDLSLLEEDDAYVMYIEYEGGWVKRNITHEQLDEASEYWYDVEDYLEFEVSALLGLFTYLYDDYPKFPDVLE